MTTIFEWTGNKIILQALNNEIYTLWISIEIFKTNFKRKNGSCTCNQIKNTKIGKEIIIGSFHRMNEVKWSEVKVAQSCPTLCDPMDYTVHGILQARILEWIAIPLSRGSSQPGEKTQVSHIVGQFFTSWAQGRVASAYPSLICKVGRGGCCHANTSTLPTSKVYPSGDEQNVIRIWGYKA